MPIAEASKGLKTLKTARASYWLKLACAWDRRHVRSGSAPFCASPVDQTVTRAPITA